MKVKTADLTGPAIDWVVANPRSLHDAMRRIQSLSGAAHRDLTAFIDNPTDYDSKEFMEFVAEAVAETKVIAAWVRDTYKDGVRKE
jgi:hypothetical protein